jgi:hypothetical protein
MGRILNAEEITQNLVTTYLKNATQDYSVFLKSAPTFITYYSKNAFLSTYDKAFQTAFQTIGAESPIKFDKIKNLPIYSVQNSSFGTEITDFGISGDVKSNAIIIPNTVIPMVDDCFIVPYNNVLKLFQVTDVEVDNYNDNKYYKITFGLSSYNISDIDAQVDKTLFTDYKLLGNETITPFTEVDNYTAYSNLQLLADSLIMNYNDKYYDENLTYYVDKQTVNLTDYFILDHNLNNFIAENKINVMNFVYRSYNYINRDLLENVDRVKYKKTIFMHMKDSAVDLTTNVIYKNNLVNPYSKTLYSAAWMYKTPYNTITEEDSTFTPGITDVLVTPLPSNVYDAITANDPTGLNPYETILVKFFNKTYETSPGSISDLVNDANYLDDYDDNYYVIPLCLYVIKFYINKIITKT